MPVTPLPDGSGVDDRHARSAGHHGVGVRLELSAHVLDRRCSTSCASATRGAPSIGPRRSCRPSAGRRSDFPGIPSNAQFPNTLPTFLIGGYQQLGSPANTATDFSTSVTRDRRHADLGEGPAHGQGGRSTGAGSGSNVIQPPSPTGSFTFNNLGSDLPGVDQHRHAVRQLPARPGADSSRSTCSRQQIQERARIPGVLRPGRLAASIDRLTINAGPALHAELPVDRDQRPDRGLQPADRSSSSIPGDGAGAAAEERQLRPAPRHRLPRHRQDASSAPATGWSGSRWPASRRRSRRRSFPFLQTVSQRALDTHQAGVRAAERPDASRRFAPTPRRRPRAGRLLRWTATLGSGYVQQWNVVGAARADAATRRRGRLCRLEDHARRHSRHQPQSADGRAARAGQRRCCSACPIRTSASFRAPRRSAIRRSRVAQLLKPYPQYTTVSLYRNNVGTTYYHGLTLKLEQRLTRGLSYLVSYTRSQADGRCVVGVRCVDPDRPGGELSGGRQLQPPPRARLLDRRHPARLRRVGGVGRCRRAAAARTRCTAARRARQRLDGRGVVTLQSGVPVAVTQTTNFNAFAGFGTQRPNLVGDPELPADERTPSALVRHGGVRVGAAVHAGHRLAQSGPRPGYRNVDLARQPPRAAGGRTSLELRAEIFNLLNTPPFGAPNGVARRRRLRNHHHRRRSARGAARGQGALLRETLPKPPPGTSVVAVAWCPAAPRHTAPVRVRMAGGKPWQVFWHSRPRRRRS